MQINVEKREDIIIIKCSGNIDADSYTEFKNTFDKIIVNGDLKIIVDLSGVNFISSSGWGVIIESLQKVRMGGGDILLAAMTEEVKNVYQTVSFNELLRSYDKLEDAIKSYK